MAVDDGPLRNVNGWDDWLHRACPPNILDIAIRALGAWANCEYPLRFGGQGQAGMHYDGWFLGVNNHFACDVHDKSAHSLS